MRLLWLAVLLWIGSPARSLPQQANRRLPSVKEAQRQLLDLENHWLAVENDPQALDAILAADFLHVLPAGIITKQEQLGYMRSHPAPERSQASHFEQMRVRIYGNVGIVNGMVVASGPGTNRKTLFTDVFAYRAGRWQAVNAQELPVAENAR
ncbi:MAG TPA: nuclear transport factor 2 family protein [Candidatus Acidoferrales bacterium]|nr:nuclear transport factor 2 family protein [Candidatus Acidoferrales bacterium]